MEEKKPAQRLEATDTAEEDEMSVASPSLSEEEGGAGSRRTSPAPEPEPVAELGPNATGNPMNDDSTSDDDSEPGAD